MDTARFSNFIAPDSDPKEVRYDGKGKNSVGIIALGFNEPKGQEALGGKVTRVVLENYLRRPSLKEEALKKLTEFAHDATCVQQAPGYQAECAMGLLLTQGNQFRWVVTGDVRIFHFVNGQIMETNRGTSPRLGSGKTREMPEVLAETGFRQGENSFLLCSGSFTRYVSDQEIENALSLSDNAEEWLRTLREMYESRCEDEPYALMTVFMPEKRRRLPKKAVIAIIVALVVLAVGAFFALGAARRRDQRGPGGPGNEPTRPPMEQGGPGMEPTRPPRPERPPQGQGEGEPGEEPTEPPKPTEPPQPEKPADPGAPEGGAES